MTTEPSEKDILDGEDRRFRALASNDIPVLESLLADDLRYVHSNGVVEDKAEFLHKLRSGERRYHGYRAITRETRQEGGFTFVFGETEVEIERAAGNLKTRMTYTAAYRNRPEPRLAIWHSVKSYGS